MIAKSIIYFENKCILICDGKCNKAWGMNNRKEKDSGEYYKDNELKTAPVNPGTYEGGHAKPKDNEQILNKWCCRECEISKMVKDNEDFELPIF